MGTMAMAKQKAAKHKLQRDALPVLAWAGLGVLRVSSVSSERCPKKAT